MRLLPIPIRGDAALVRHHVLGGRRLHLRGDLAGGVLQGLQRDANQEVQVTGGLAFERGKSKKRLGSIIIHRRWEDV